MKGLVSKETTVQCHGQVNFLANYQLEVDKGNSTADISRVITSLEKTKEGLNNA